MFERLRAWMDSAQAAVDERRQTPEGKAEFAKLELRLQDARTANLERAPRVFQYFEWLLVFAVVDYTRQVTDGLISWCLLGAEALLAITVHYYIIARAPPIGPRALHWGNVFSLRGWLVPGLSAILTASLICLGYSLATAIAEVQFGKAAPATSTVSATCESTSLAYRSQASQAAEQCKP